MPILIVIIIVVVALGGAVYWNNGRSDTSASTTPSTETVRSEVENTVTITTPSDAPTDSPVTAPADAVVQDGLPSNYIANTTYLTPKRTSHTLAVSLTLEGDTVTDASVQYDGKDTGFSNNYQERFDAEYKTLVIGKKLTDISLSRVGGASLTSESFNEAVKQIAIEATAS